ncbi:MAE_28990/MAE_18760 family HEPN-like nuclease [Coleofasciculus chthonoplastes]|uniref:MAE_28990/MAE_18760 family HEPN-like nuclease n=1 Tax=Coleofasciculus chthonoplastes TaxID=64178 RepID=UPI0032F30B70
MRSILFEEFNERAKEVSKYLMFIKNLEQETVQLSIGIPGKEKIRKIDSDLEKTLKASGFLMLYNLIESTMRNAIHVIFDELSSEGISFDEMKYHLKTIIIKNIKKNHSPDKLLNNIQSISVDIISASFDRDKLFSGNLDAGKIKDIAKEYGFSYTTNARKTGNGSDLLTIKTNRNDLAHGFYSFNDVGKDVSADELLRIKRTVVFYLREILQNIENYLANRDYLDSSGRTP